MNEKKKLRRISKRILSFVMVLAMVLTLMPGTSMEVKAETQKISAQNFAITKTAAGYRITANAVNTGIDGDYWMVWYGNSNPKYYSYDSFYTAVTEDYDIRIIGIIDVGSVYLISDTLKTNSSDAFTYESYNTENLDVTYSGELMWIAVFKVYDKNTNTYPYQITMGATDDIPTVLNQSKGNKIGGGDGTPEALPHSHDWKYVATDNEIDAYCANEGCDNYAASYDDAKSGNKLVALNLSVTDANYTGSATYSGAKILDTDNAEIKSDNTNKWTSAELAIPTIKYFKATVLGGTEGTEEVTNLNGLTAGNYYASVTVGEGDNQATAKAAFKIIPPHTHNGITFDKPLTLADIKSQGIEAGNYYLTEDLELTRFIYITNKKVNLCLNGHVLKAASGQQVIKIGNGGELNLYDCDDTVHKFGDDNGLWVWDDSLEGDAVKHTVTGGVITGGDENNWNGGGAISVSGQYLGKKSTLNMYGGNIVGNKSHMYGGGVMSSGIFNMKAGTIQGNNAPKGAGVYHANSDAIFNLLGGEITKNIATAGDGGGVYSDYPETFSVGGNAKIYDNHRGLGDTATNNNVYLYSSYITLNTGSDAPTNGMEIYVLGINDQVIVDSGASESDVSYFKSDDDTLSIKHEEGKLKFFLAHESANKSSFKEPEKVFVDLDTNKSEVAYGTVFMHNKDNVRNIFDMKVHSVDARTKANQEFLTASYAKNQGKRARILITTGIYPRNKLAAKDIGTKKFLSFLNLEKKIMPVYAVCYNQTDKAYYLTGTMNANGTAVFNDFIARDATNITIFVLE